MAASAVALGWGIARTLLIFLWLGGGTFLIRLFSTILSSEVSNVFSGGAVPPRRQNGGEQLFVTRLQESLWRPEAQTSSPCLFFSKRPRSRYEEA